MKLSSDTAAELSKRPITYDAGFTLLPGTYTLKFLARDAETGRIGTYLRTFVIPNLNKELQKVLISSVVLSSQLVDMQDALYNAKDKLHAQNVSPLVQGGRKLVPSVTHVFSRGKDMYAYVQAYQQTTVTAQPMIGFVAFYQDERKVYEAAPVAVTTGMENRLKTMPLQFRFPLDKLAPGEYVCQVTVLSPGEHKAAFSRTHVMITP